MSRKLTFISGYRKTKKWQLAPETHLGVSVPIYYDTRRRQFFYEFPEQQIGAFNTEEEAREALRRTLRDYLTLEFKPVIRIEMLAPWATDFRYSESHPEIAPPGFFLEIERLEVATQINGQRRRRPFGAEDDDFYRGHDHPDHWSFGSKAKAEIPYDEALWEKLSEMQRMGREAGWFLHRLINRPPEEISALLAGSGTLLLQAPPQAEENDDA